jgi:succinate-semialdehyde dehydrogenase/glutarate-semialdehyde dehydrogenase
VIGKGSELGEPLVGDPRVRAISFTGSVPVGRGVRDQAAHLGKRVQLELGGHNPLIVAEDADLGRAVEAAYAGAFWSAGQKCTATRRIYAQDSVYDEFRSRFLARIEAGKVGDPTDPETEVGPLVNQHQCEDVLSGIERGREQGGRVLAGGERVDPDAYLIAPTLFEDVADDAFLSCEEVFGPVTSLYRFDTLDDAIARANDTNYGLGSSIWTHDARLIHRAAQEIEAGMTWVNQIHYGYDELPFGGVKDSGFGKEHGIEALDSYVEIKSVVVGGLS